jgi:hypothetical protein
VSFSLRRLRTTPARKPRTECGCQSVASIILAIVAPAGDRSIERTCDCFVPESGLFGFDVPSPCDAVAARPSSPDVADADFAALAFLAVPSGFAAETGPRDRTGAGFFADFAMRSSIRFCGYAAPPKPHHSNDAGGA